MESQFNESVIQFNVLGNESVAEPSVPQCSTERVVTGFRNLSFTILLAFPFGIQVFEIESVSATRPCRNSRFSRQFTDHFFCVTQYTATRTHTLVSVTLPTRKFSHFLAISVPLSCVTQYRHPSWFPQPNSVGIFGPSLPNKMSFGCVTQCTVPRT